MSRADLERLDNVNVVASDLLPTPDEVKRAQPLTDSARDTVLGARGTLRDILDRRDPRLLVVVGPCSIHDLAAAREYAGRLRQLARSVESTMFVMMRVYFEKPRTTVGWKGLINDPFMDDSFDIEKGITLARELLLRSRGNGAASRDRGARSDHAAVSRGADQLDGHRRAHHRIADPPRNGERTLDAGRVQERHRRYADRRHQRAALGAAAAPLPRASRSKGSPAVFHTRGNAYGHIVLRGGGGRTNYDSVSVRLCEDELEKVGLPANIMVDCSHGNSKQESRTAAARAPRTASTRSSRATVRSSALMLESNLYAGNQAIPADRRELRYGVSITDGCIGWEGTSDLLLSLHEKLATSPRVAATPGGLSRTRGIDSARAPGSADVNEACRAACYDRGRTS